MVNLVCPCCPWLILCTNHFVWVVCKLVWVSESCQLYLVPSWSSNMPPYPWKCCELGSVPWLLPLPLSSTWTQIRVLQRVGSASGSSCPPTWKTFTNKQGPYLFYLFFSTMKTSSMLVSNFFKNSTYTYKTIGKTPCSLAKSPSSSSNCLVSSSSNSYWNASLTPTPTTPFAFIQQNCSMLVHLPYVAQFIFFPFSSQTILLTIPNVISLDAKI